MSKPFTDPNCIFCKMVSGEIPVKPLLENSHAIVIADINPQAPIHALAIPKHHVPSFAALTPADADILTSVMFAAGEFARSQGLDSSGYRLNINHGVNGGQTVGHLHVHILGGRKMTWPPG